MSRKPTTADLLRWARGAEQRWFHEAVYANTRRGNAGCITSTVYVDELRGMVQTLATLRRMGA